MRWLRQRPGVNLSAQALADRTRELGHELKRSVIANLESGRRTSVSVADLVVLAVALDVPPAMLVYPVGEESTVEALPGIETDTVAALGWFTGASGRPFFARGDDSEGDRTIYPIFKLYSRYGEYRRRVRQYSVWLRENPSDDSVRDLLAESRRELQSLRETIRDHGLAIPDDVDDESPAGGTDGEVVA
ncbi:hypothetical protein ASU32_22725 [Tsukamurella tyrosinosolvens]|nr:hypothetical protein ASU32_22725 [Tsukamurella tyrosinosolvens]